MSMLSPSCARCCGQFVTKRTAPQVIPLTLMLMMPKTITLMSKLLCCVCLFNACPLLTCLLLQPATSCATAYSTSSCATSCPCPAAAPPRSRPGRYVSHHRTTPSPPPSFFGQVGLSSITGPPSSLFRWQPPPTGGWLYDESTSLGAPPNAYQVQALAHAFSLALRQEQLLNERYTCFWRLRPDGIVNVEVGAYDGMICNADTAVFHGHMEQGVARVLTDFM
jgi:hypothetical protein